MEHSNLRNNQQQQGVDELVTIGEKEGEDQTQQFSFDINEAFTVEKVVRATFANPERRKFEDGRDHWNYHSLYKEDFDCESLIEMIREALPKSLAGFNQEKIQLFDTFRLYLDTDKAQWLAGLKSLAWYGPFESGERCVFQTATASGVFWGFCLAINLNQKYVSFRFLKDNKECGEEYFFDEE